MSQKHIHIAFAAIAADCSICVTHSVNASRFATSLKPCGIPSHDPATSCCYCVAAVPKTKTSTMSTAFSSGKSCMTLARMFTALFATHPYASSRFSVGVRQLSSLTSLRSLSYSSGSYDPSQPKKWDMELDITSLQNSKVKLMRCVSYIATL